MDKGRRTEALARRGRDQRKGIRWGDWGEGVVLYAGFVLPPGLPAGAYPIEAALLEPRLGVTISRHSVPLPDAGTVRGTIRCGALLAVGMITLPACRDR